MKGIRINTACGNTGRVLDSATLYCVQPTGSAVPRNVRKQRSAGKVSVFSSLHYKAKVHEERIQQECHITARMVGDRHTRLLAEEAAVPKNELDDVDAWADLAAMVRSLCK